MGHSSSKSSRKTDHSSNGSGIHVPKAQADESPPSYSAATFPAPSQLYAENALLAIRNYNVVFVIDDSASMNGKGPNGVKLWTEVHILLLLV
jgi:hypothetical protein